MLRWNKMSEIPPPQTLDLAIDIGTTINNLDVYHPNLGCDHLSLNGEPSYVDEATTIVMKGATWRGCTLW